MRNNTKDGCGRPQSSSRVSGKSQRNEMGHHGHEKRESTKNAFGAVKSPSSNGKQHTNSRLSNRKSSGTKPTQSQSLVTGNSDWSQRYASIFSVSRVSAKRMLEISYPGCQVTPGDISDLLIMLDSWIAIIADLMDTDSTRSLVHSIIDTGLQVGVIKLIQAADVSADSIIANGWYATDIPYPFDRVVQRVRLSCECSSSEIYRVLQILRFPKRFSPEIAKRYLEDATLKAYLDWDNRVGQLATSHVRSLSKDRIGLPGRYYPLRNVPKQPYGYLGMRLKEIIHSWLRFYQPQFIGCEGYDEALMKQQKSGNILTIPTGSTSDCGTNSKRKAEKLLSAIGDVEFVDPITDTTFAEVIVVNKNYKTPRTIAKEPMKRATLQKVVRRELIAALTLASPVTSDKSRRDVPIFHFEDQGINRMFCWLTEYATLDIHQASDSIPWELIRYLFPMAVVYDLDFVRSDTIKIGGKLRCINKAFTSGAGCCFEVESIFFGAIAFLALELHSTWNRKKSVRGITTVYGDDIVISSEVADLCIQLLTIFGITLSPEKSHYLDNDPYRESCGVEVFDGYEVSSVFYPRKTVIEYDRRGNFLLDRTANILAKLQQRLYREGYLHASAYISDIVRSVKPNVRFGPDTMEHDGLTTNVVIPVVPDSYFKKKNPLLPLALREHLHEITVVTSTKPVSEIDDETVRYHLWLYRRQHRTTPVERIPFVEVIAGERVVSHVEVLVTESPLVGDDDQLHVKMVNRVTVI